MYIVNKCDNELIPCPVCKRSWLEVDQVSDDLTYYNMNCDCGTAKANDKKFTSKEECIKDWDDFVNERSMEKYYEMKGMPVGKFLSKLFKESYGDVYHLTLNPEGKKL